MNRRDLLKASLFGAAAAPAFAQAAARLPSGARVRRLRRSKHARARDAVRTPAEGDRRQDLRRHERRVAFGPAARLREDRDRRRASSAGAKRRSRARPAPPCRRSTTSRYFVIGSDPMQVEHHWQSMYIHSFYRGGPVLGSAISGIDQALWDIRGKVLGLPVYELLGGPIDERGVRGYYHVGRLHAGAPREQLPRVGGPRSSASPASRPASPATTSGSRHTRSIKEAIEAAADAARGMGRRHRHRRRLPRQDQPDGSLQICREVEPLNLMFVEEPCPPENVKAMKRIADRTTMPIATANG